MEILLNHNKGYKWVNKSNIHFKGYFIDNTGNLYKGEKALIKISEDVHDEETMLEFLKSIDGIFSFIIEIGDQTLCAVDRARSLPLFFDKSGQALSDSCEAIREYLGINKDDIDPDLYLALYAKMYIMGKYTVYSNICQLDGGQFAILTEGKSPCYIRYFSHFSSLIKKESYNDLRKKLYGTSIEVFEKIKKAIDGRPVVISLSGGYDSRFVACMLKKVGVRDVSCYTYGKSNSFEVKQSKKNAEALGFRWICVEYTDEVVNGFLDNVGMSYLHSYDTHDYTGYLQNFPAVKVLHEQGWFKEGSVFLTGLCGDMPSGYYIPREEEKVDYNNDYAVDWLYNIIYSRQKPDEQFHMKWKQYIAQVLNDNQISVWDYQTFVSAVDFIYTLSCHSRGFLNMNRAHDFFGYEWLLPYWDKNLLKLWYSIPAQYRCKQKIYEDFLLEDLCSEYGIGQKKTTVGYSYNPLKRKLTYFGGSVLAFICLNLGIPFRRKYDFNNFAPFELKLFQKLKSKKTVVWHKAAIVSLYTQYILQERYGVNNMLKAKSRIIKD